MLDFDGNDSVAIKYGVYTLVCEQLLARLEDLQVPLRRPTSLSMDGIWTKVDEALKDVLEVQPGSLTEGVEIAAFNLEGKCRALATVNRPIADVLSRVVDDVRACGGDWDYRLAVERWRAVGRKLGQRFYEGSPHSITRERLAREPALAFEYVSQAGEAPFGYREECWAMGGEPEDGLIVVRFSFSDRFVNYLAYPFFFLHEYVSHVYGADTCCQLLEDGWLLCAADDFFRQQVILHRFPDLCPERADIFEWKIRPHMSQKKALDGYRAARLFSTWCNARLPGRFQAINHELAALPVEASFPHGDSLYALVDGVNTYPDDLFSWLCAIPTCQELWRRLRSIRQPIFVN